MKNKGLATFLLTAALTIICTFTVNAEETALKRIYGSNSIETSIEIAKELNPQANTYVIATTEDYPDALAGTILAAKYNAPILFVSKGDNSSVYNYLKSANANSSTTFYILGGTGAVSQSVEDKLKSISSTVIRLGGINRFDTCSIINSAMNFKTGNPIIIATGQDYPDALSVSAIGGQLQYPILLVNNQSIPDAIAKQIQSIKPSTVYIAGGTGVVSSSVEQKITSLVSTKIVRFAGVDRYETSMKIADYFKDSLSNDIYTTGYDFHDSLAVSPLASSTNSSIILVDNSNYKRQASVSKHKGYIIGSPTTLSDEVGKSMANDGSSPGETPTLGQFTNCTTTNSSVQLSVPVAKDLTWVWYTVVKDGAQKNIFAQPKNAVVNNKLYLNSGGGLYNVEVWATTGDRYGTYTKKLGQFKIENLDQRDMTYLLPEEYIESDNAEIINLANQITKGLSSDMEKTKAIHDWIATNIAYDTDAYFKGDIHNYSSLETLHGKKALCSGYAYLNAALHRAAGIKAKVVDGAVIYLDQGQTWENTDLTTSTHAWNEIYINGNWIIEDTTWDAGYVNNSTHKFTFELSHKYFNPSAAEFSKDHVKIEEE